MKTEMVTVAGLMRSAYETPFEMWKRTNVVKQKQDGYVTAAIKLFMGDITAEQMLFVADLAERYSNGNLRTTINQNLVIRWVPTEGIGEFYDDLTSHGLADPGAELVEDIIACPGTIHAVLGSPHPKAWRERWPRCFQPAVSQKIFRM